MYFRTDVPLQNSFFNSTMLVAWVHNVNGEYLLNVTENIILHHSNVSEDD